MAVWLGVDVGSVRVGVAKSDATELLASPLETLPRAQALERVLALVAEWDAAGLIVGRPVTLRGRAGASVAMADEFADAVRAAAPSLPIETVDERHTSVTAARRLREAGVNARQQRGRLDAHAAAELLQLWLDTRRNTDRTTDQDTARAVEEASR